MSFQWIDDHHGLSSPLSSKRKSVLVWILGCWFEFLACDEICVIFWEVCFFLLWVLYDEVYLEMGVIEVLTVSMYVNLWLTILEGGIIIFKKQQQQRKPNFKKGCELTYILMMMIFGN